MTQCNLISLQEAKRKLVKKSEVGIYYNLLLVAEMVKELEHLRAIADQMEQEIQWSQKSNREAKEEMARMVEQLKPNAVDEQTTIKTHDKRIQVQVGRVIVEENIEDVVNRWDKRVVSLTKKAKAIVLEWHKLLTPSLKEKEPQNWASYQLAINRGNHLCQHLREMKGLWICTTYQPHPLLMHFSFKKGEISRVKEKKPGGVFQHLYLDPKDMCFGLKMIGNTKRMGKEEDRNFGSTTWLQLTPSQNRMNPN
eukprot:Gb_29119 [translate_table: standard]